VMPYFTKHALDRYIDRRGGVTRKHALTQLSGMWDVAQRGEQMMDGSVRYRVCDLVMVYQEKTNAVVTCW